ncbi:MAG: hypothetical protein AB7P23_03700 [Amphiplicatus sp.]
MAERLIDTLSQPAPLTRKLAFLDIEASGLGSRSWPVEAGWAFAEGGVSSTLIRPDPSWSDDAWEEAAERLHGLDRARLEREGRRARDVCAEMNEALKDADVYSDAPDWDGFWLFRLFSACGVKQAFALKDYARLMRPLIEGKDEDEIMRRAARLAPRRHRAADDVRHLQTLYRLASENGGPRPA